MGKPRTAVRIPTADEVLLEAQRQHVLRSEAVLREEDGKYDPLANSATALRAQARMHAVDHMVLEVVELTGITSHVQLSADQQSSAFTGDLDFSAEGEQVLRNTADALGLEGTMVTRQSAERFKLTWTGAID